LRRFIELVAERDVHHTDAQLHERRERFGVLAAVEDGCLGATNADARTAHGVGIELERSRREVPDTIDAQPGSPYQKLILIERRPTLLELILRQIVVLVLSLKVAADAETIEPAGFALLCGRKLLGTGGWGRCWCGSRSISGSRRGSKLRRLLSYVSFGSTCRWGS
jgi:hypothetical protein